VEVTLRPVATDQQAARQKFSFLDLAGSARELLRDVDVDQMLDKLRNEWGNTSAIGSDSGR